MKKVMLLLLALVSILTVKADNEPISPISKPTNLIEGSYLLNYDVEMVILVETDGVDGGNLQIVRKQVDAVYSPDGTFRRSVKTITPENEAYRELIASRSSFVRGEGELVTIADNSESEQKVSELIVTNEVTQLLDGNGKVLDSTPTDPAESKELVDLIKTGKLFTSCKDFEDWLKKLKESGCTIDDSSDKNKICVTCRNEDGTVTTTTVNLISRNWESVYTYDSSGRTINIQVLDSECNGEFPKLRKLVEKYFSYDEKGAMTTTTISSTYHNYQLNQN